MKRYRSFIEFALVLIVLALVLFPVQNAKVPAANAATGDCSGVATTTNGPNTVTAQHTGVTAPHIAYFRTFQTVTWAWCHWGLYGTRIGTVTWSNDFWVNSCVACQLDGWHLTKWEDPVVTSGTTTDQFGGIHHWVKRVRKAEFASCVPRCFYLYPQVWQRITSDGGYTEGRNMS